MLCSVHSCYSRLRCTYSATALRPQLLSLLFSLLSTLSLPPPPPQRFFAMFHGGEVNVDQAHRGYSVATEGTGYASPNPLFMKYTPSEGRFVGQAGYGYRSIEVFVEAVRAIASGRASARDFDHSLASIHTTFQTTAILEAGRRSLDAHGAAVELLYGDANSVRPTGFRTAGGAAVKSE